MGLLFGSARAGTYPKSGHVAPPPPSRKALCNSPSHHPTEKLYLWHVHRLIAWAKFAHFPKYPFIQLMKQSTSLIAKLKLKENFTALSCQLSCNSVIQIRSFCLVQEQCWPYLGPFYFLWGTKQVAKTDLRNVLVSIFRDFKYRL